jgi:hypothetical protein
LREHNLWDERPFWQPNYCERIIRHEAELNRIREYIQYNPTAWLYDHENPAQEKDASHERRWAWLEDHELPQGQPAVAAQHAALLLRLVQQGLCIRALDSPISTHLV